ncbi:MAG: SLAC1 anion channel family protein [Rhodocyclaceae bacterium]|jgi:tellurite resistance protein|nr:SLAC1 anion channel family protein [Rhodocyclaceae bacterium]
MNNTAQTRPQAASAAPPTLDSRLEHFPVALFSTVMGTAGLAIAWKKAHAVLGLPASVWQVVAAIASALFVLLAAIYAVKVARHPAAVAAERGHPVRVNFFPAISIGVLLLAIVWAEDAPVFAGALWAVGAAAHLGFTLMAMSSWIHHTHYDIKHANPAWFIPVVGNIIVPVVGVKFAPLEVSWFFFSIGLVFWLVLLTIVMYRLFFHEPLPVRLTPTLFILLAPPSVGFIAYIGLTGELDGFGRVLYYTALFLTLLLSTNAARFFRVPFFVSAWAYSFPLAAMTIATLVMYERTGLLFFAAIGSALLVVLSGIVAVLVVKTVQTARRGELYVPE